MKTKYLKRILWVTLSAIIMSSCDSFLDTTPEDLRSPDQIFSTYASTEKAMFGVYSYIRTYNAPTMPSMHSTSDVDMAYTSVVTFDMGAWTASSAPHDKWYAYYKAIREATYFLQNLDKCPESEVDSSTREQWRAEVRCVRAYYYAQLMRMYGPVILLKDELADFTSTDLDRARNTWDECVEWISTEFKELSENPYLPLIQEGNNYARMSKAIALAYRARILLQSASDQFNGNPMYAGVKNPDETPLFPAQKDPNKWKLARQAAQDVINLGCYDLIKVLGSNGHIDPYASYKSVFTTSQNKEMIFSFLETDGYFDKRMVPNSIGGYAGGYAPTQEMVDSYAMNSGRYPIRGYLDENRNEPDIDYSTGYSENGFANFTHPLEKVQRNTFKMYIDREPRFYVSVFYGGITWFIPNKTSERIFMEMFKNGNNGPDASHNHCTTGYNTMKLLSPEYEGNPAKGVKREIPYMRYAEILMNYVEAGIETGELADPNILTYWNMIRERSGLPNIEETYPEAINDQKQLRVLVRRERRIEFAFEGMNFYDCRRWLTGESTERNYIHGMNIQAVGKINTNSYPVEFYQRTIVEKRVFTPSFYLFPIPQSAINKNKLLVQNYKW